MTPLLRWMIARDMDEVIAIEEMCFENPWDEQDLTFCLRQRNIVGMVAECSEKIVAYVVYEIHNELIHVLNMAVHPSYRRKGIGATVIDTLKGKLSEQRRNCITTEVRETSLEAQLFLREMGFLANEILHEFFPDSGEDAYQMEYVKGETMCD